MSQDYITNPLDSGEILKFRKELEAKVGTVYNTDELKAKFEVIGFCAPYVAVKDRETNKKGSLQFTHLPRFYFNFIAD